MEPGETANQIDGVLVGPNRRPALAWPLEFDLRQQAGSPAQGEVDGVFAPRCKDDDLLDHSAQQFLLVPCRGGGRIPNALEVLSESEKRTLLGVVKTAGPITLAALQFTLCFLECFQTLFPIPLQPARDETMLRLDRPISPLGPLGFVAGPLDRHSRR